MEIGFDVVSDLYLDPNESFNWEGKATSLYCIVAGNISSDLRTIFQTLGHLSRFYQGIFYVPGTLEYQDIEDTDIRTEELLGIVKQLPNVAMLYHHVVIIDGIAILGTNGWNHENLNERTDFSVKSRRIQDLAYLKKSIEKLQKHLDVKKILVVTNAVPKRELYFGEEPVNLVHLDLDYCLESDTEKKVYNWIFGSYNKIVDTTLGNINYVNNSYYKRRPYWAKRISITV